MPSLRKIFCTVLIFILTVPLLASCRTSSAPEKASPTSAPTSSPAATATPVPYFPRHLNLQKDLIPTGAVLTSNAVCPEITNGLPGGVILGIDPNTCRPVEKGEQSVTIQLDIPAEFANSVILMKIAWPDEKDRGLRAIDPDGTLQVVLNNQVIWQKKARIKDELANGYQYAARHDPLLVSFVVDKPGEHTLRLTTPPGMIWDIGSIDFSASPKPNQILGIAYSPYRDCQSPDTKAQPVESDIEQDLKQIYHSANALRTYSAAGINAAIASLANQADIPIYAGVGIDGKPDADDAEMEGINQVVKTASVAAVIVGNEFYLRHQKEPDAIDNLLARIRQFKAKNPGIPVATAEVDSMIFEWKPDGSPEIKAIYRPILDEIDILLIHIYPFWENRPVEGAAQFTVARYHAVEKLLQETYAGKKQLIIGEAGWPSQGLAQGMSGGSAASNSPGETVGANAGAQIHHPDQQRRYMIELLQLARKESVNLFYFDMYDELWKQEGLGGVGRSWGYNFSDRTAKYNFSSLLLPPEQFPSAESKDTYQEQPFLSETAPTWSLPIYTEWPRDPLMTDEQSQNANLFIPGFMGDQKNIDFFSCDAHPHTGSTAVRVSYVPGGIKGWAGIYWLYPEENWGVTSQGLNLQSMQTLSFWARGKNGGEVAEFLVGGICGKYDGKTPPLCPDSLQPKLSTERVVLGSNWQQFTFDLSQVDISNMVGGFGLALSQVYNAAGAEIYVDDVILSAESAPATARIFPQPPDARFPIYTDYDALDNHYIPSNFMGDGETGDLNIDLNWQTAPQNGKSAIRVDYARGKKGWAGVYWTDPEDNWGERPGGYDLNGVQSLSFWARSDEPGKRLEVIVGGIGCFDSRKPHHDTVCGKISYFIQLGTDWQQYTLKLSNTRRDWSRLLGGFGFVTKQSGSFYLDDVVYTLQKP